MWIYELHALLDYWRFFYKKHMSSKNVMHSRSAFPIQTKRSVLTQKLLRIFLRCSPLLEWNQVIIHANDLMKRLQYSGYSEKFRSIVVHSALKAYDTIKQKDRDGIEPLHRPKHWKQEEREQKKINKKENWYRTSNSNAKSVMFVPCTPGSTLKKKYEDILKQSNIEISVVEKGGTPLLQKFKSCEPCRTLTLHM